MLLPVFESLNVTSGRTTPTLVDAGSRSQILGREHPLRGQTRDRNLVVSQVIDFSLGPVFIGSFFLQKTTSYPASSLKTAVIAEQR